MSAPSSDRLQTGRNLFKLLDRNLGLDHGMYLFIIILIIVIKILIYCDPLLIRQGRPDKTYRERIWADNQPGLWSVTYHIFLPSVSFLIFMSYNIIKTTNQAYGHWSAKYHIFAPNHSFLIFMPRDIIITASQG